jgi:hypothetical protein
MGLLSKLFGKEDPTAGWPAATGKPAIDLERGAVGPIRLGDPVEKARELGRPDSAKRLGPSGGLLEYAEFDLEFDKGQLVCAQFDLDAGQRVSVAGFGLSPASTPLDIKSWLGDPTSDSDDGKRLRWIDFERGDATLALEFTDGRLSCVQLYGKDYA